MENSYRNDRKQVGSHALLKINTSAYSISTSKSTLYFIVIRLLLLKSKKVQPSTYADLIAHRKQEYKYSNF